VGRLRIVVAVLGLLWATTSEAQPLYTGMLTGHIGAAAGGDVRDSGVTPGASLSVIEASGLGAELDLAYTPEFDDDLFDESGITSLMLNVIGVFRAGDIQPFVESGVGLLRLRTSLRTSFADGDVVRSRTDWAFNAGGGVAYMFNDAVGVRGDVRYFRCFERHGDLPLLDNGFFEFWRTSVGITYHWPLR
jgi:opacity protein-like surface antigen